MAIASDDEFQSLLKKCRVVLKEIIPGPCYCGKTRFKQITAESNWMCHQCWKVQKGEEYYECGDEDQCVNLIGDRCPDACPSCAFNERLPLPKDTSDISAFIIEMIERALDLIRLVVSILVGV